MPTEAEMKKLWCPEVRMVPLPHTSQTINNRGANIDKYNCIGTDCAAWRWENQSSASMEKHGMLGYCGKAGKP